MSSAHDTERCAMTHEQAMERARRVIQELIEINRCTYQGQPISTIARQLGMSREKVLYLRRVLKWDTWGRSRGRGHDARRGAVALAISAGEG